MNLKRYKIVILWVVLIACKSETQSNNLQQNQNQLESLKEKAESKYKADLYEEAIEAYTELIKLDSSKGEYYYKRAYSYSQLDSPKFLVQDYIKSSELGYRKYDCFYSLGVIYSGILLNDSLAIHYFEKALEERPSSKEVKLMLENLKNSIEKSDTIY